METPAPDIEFQKFQNILLDFETIEVGGGKLHLISPASGRSLSVSVEPKYITIDADDNNEVFVDISTSDTNGIRLLHIGIQTKETQTAKSHPDLRAGEIVDAAIKYFNNKNPLDGVKFDWKNNFLINNAEGNLSSDTLIQYVEERNKSPQETLSDIQRKAAFSTWTGRRVAMKHGFITIKDLQEEINTEGEIIRVTGKFMKSEPSGPDRT